MIGLSKKPDYITDDTEGRVYQGYANNRLRKQVQVSNFIKLDYYE